MKRRQAAEKVATQLFAAERAVDVAMAEMADLFGTLPRARLEGGLSAVVGQGAVDHVADALQGLAQVRRAVVAAHGELAITKDKIGMRHVTMQGGEKDDGTTKPPPIAQLREVA